LTITFAQFFERAFGKSGKGSNIAHSACFEMILCIILFLVIYGMTGAKWAAYAGSTCIALAVIFGAAAVLSQSVSQLIRWLESIRAKISGEEPRVFKEDDPLCSKIIRNAFTATATRAKRATGLFSPIKAANPARVFRVNARVRSNARAHRHASHLAFAHSSHDGGGGNDDSGGSDSSGDPPEPPYHTALKLSQTFYHKSNSFSCPRRSSRASGCWRMPCRNRFFRRWAV
jgi:hypothetical protein